MIVYPTSVIALHEEPPFTIDAAACSARLLPGAGAVGRGGLDDRAQTVRESHLTVILGLIAEHARRALSRLQNRCVLPLIP